MDEDEKSVDFLLSDFAQSFDQLRHYDRQISDILKFSFTGYTALIGLAFAVYEYGFKYHIDFRTPIVFVLLVGLILGLLNYVLLIRYRAYYVQIAHYINEIRNHFLKDKPMKFQNLTGMYTNRLMPPYFNWRSTQSLTLYIIAFLNGVMTAVLIYFAGCTDINNIFIPIGAIFVICTQLVIGIIYLKTRKDKSAEKAMFNEGSKK